MKAGFIHLATYGILAAVIGLSECDTVKAATVETPEKAKPESALALIKDGQSDYGIYYHASAPSCVKRAATEMQRVIRISTGVTLPILAEPRNPMICLGENDASRKAGFSSERIPDEGFRIVTKGVNIYIIGQDWADSRRKWADCESIGTYYGTCEFLERVVGVRWLMPGEWGEDIPSRAEGLTVSELDISESPSATSRSIGDLPGGNPYDRTGQWFRHNRIGTSMKPEYGHSFGQHPGTAVLLAHPEYMPLLSDGTREKPMGTRKMDSSGSDEHKLCLSNPGLVQAFSESVLETIAKEPQRQGVSIGPSDGGRWCVCPECLKYRITDSGGAWGTFGPYRYSVTPLVLKFYNEVGRAVAAKYPEHVVGGWVYSEYLFPPYEPVKVEPNVHLQIGSTDDYGYKLYRPDRLERVQRLIKEWAKIAPRLGWTDYSLWMRNPFGAPLPPGIPLMKTIYPAFGKSLKSIAGAGHPWGYGGANNYLAAKLMWNNKADVDALYREYLERAYGPAAPSIDKIYSLVEDSLKKYIIKEPQTDHEIWYDSALKVYAPIYEEMEQLYVKALTQVKTEPQRKRLEMFGENLVVFNWNMRHAGLIKERKDSVLYRSDEDFDKFMAERKDSMAIRGDFSIYVKQNWQTVLWSPEHRPINLTPLLDGTAVPLIDGNAADAAWTGSATLGQFRANGVRREPAKQQTTARVTYDADNLYVVFACDEENTGKLRANCSTRNNGGLFADDYVAVLLRPVGGKVSQVAVNSKGVVNVTPETANVKTAVVVGDRGWTVELAIPFRELGISPPSAGTVLQGNFVRGRRGSGYEMSAWSRVEEQLGDERAFGELRFNVK
jgi:hypothetical protein